MMHTETTTHNLVIDPSYQESEEMRSDIIKWGAEQARTACFNEFPDAIVKVLSNRSLGFDGDNYEMVEFTLEVTRDIPDDDLADETPTEEIPLTDV